MPTCYQRLSIPAVNPAPTAEPGWTATPVTLSLAILFVARKAKKGDCGRSDIATQPEHAEPRPVTSLR